MPTELLEKLVAEGVNVAPPPEALIHAQDKLVMRRRLEASARRCRAYAEVDRRRRRCEAFAAAIGGPMVIKTARGGYDGRGVRAGPRPRRGARRSRRATSPTGVPVLVEERVAMRRELAALVARSPFGQGAAWPVVETVQRDGICVEVIAPAPDLSDETRPARQSSWRCGWPPNSAWSGCWRSSCSRPSTAR